MKDFFYPKSIAVIGASVNPTKLGSLILQNLIKGGYEGKIYPVNRNAQEISGLKAYKKISDIPESVDLVCLVIPALQILETMQECVKKKVKAVVIITAGFKEIGQEGASLENKIKELAIQNNIRMLGPNCLGFINNLNKTNLSFASNKPLKGNVAFLSQSGAFCTAILDMSIPKNLGFAYFVSVGNKADINELDLINYFLIDKNVNVISAYLEDIVDGSLLIQNYEQSKSKKPLIILKAGQTDESKKAIESHTGSIAGAIEIFRTGIEQAGIIEAYNTRELYNYTMMFAWSKPIAGNRIAIVTNAGGPGIIATDAIVKNNLQMAEISETARRELKDSLPSESSLNNPIDVIGDAPAERYRTSIEILAKEDDIDAIMVLLTPQLVTQIEETTKFILNASQLYDKPIIPVFIGKKYTTSGLQRFYDNKVPAFSEIDDAISAVSVLIKYYERIRLSSVKKTNKKWNKLDVTANGKYHDEIKKIIDQKQTVLPDNLVQDIATEVGLTLPKQMVSDNVADLIDFAHNKYPVVLKVTNDILAHKTDVKGLYLNIADPNELISCYEKLKSDIQTLTKVKNFTVLLQEQLEYKAEFFIGANRDGDSRVYHPDIPGFGHLIVFGQGGIYTEIYHDFGYVLVPASKDDIQKSLEKTKIFQIINGARGQEPLNVKKVIEQIYLVQKLTLMYPEIASLDINPLLITEKDTVAVDIKMYVSS